MTYRDYEESFQDALPIEAYEFVGTYRTYRYTNADRVITISGNDYEPLAMKREETVTGDQSQDGVEMTIEMPCDCDLIADYAFAVSPPDLDLTVYRCHLGLNLSLDSVVFWKGPVTGFNVTDDVAKIRVPSILETVLSGDFPNFFYHQSCNHTLYDERCGISKAANTVTTTVTAISEDKTSITVADDGFANNFLNGGIVANPDANEQRLILSNTDNVLVVFYPFARLEVGDTVALSVGCDHSKETCQSKFGNVRRFGGFPYIPKDNPFVGDVG